MLTQKQKQERVNYIGGSDAGAILGFNKYRTPLTVYEEKVNKTLSNEENIYMKRGSALELYVIKEFEEDTGINVMTNIDTTIHKDHKFLAANVDGLTNDGSILEVKCVFTFGGAKRWQGGKIPPEYLCQCAHYAGVLNLEKVYLAVMEFSKPLMVLTYNRDHEFEDMMTEKLIEFWKEHVEKEVPPDPATWQEASKVFSQVADSQSEKAISVDSSEIYNQVYDLKEKIEQKKELEQNIDELKKDVMIYMKDKEELTDIDGAKLCSWKPYSASRFDTSSFKKAEPGLYGQYLKTTSSRRFII